SPAVLRACNLLAHLIHHPTESFTVSELARAIDVPRPTCDAILQALAAHRFVTRRSDRRYELGPGSIALGDAARAANPLLRVAKDATEARPPRRDAPRAATPLLRVAKAEAERLARELASCAAVTVRDGDTARVVEV